MKQLRAGVIGVGYLGKFHASKYAGHPGVELVAVVDTDPAIADSIAAENNTRACTDYHDVLDQVDLVSIAVPTEYHHQVARDCLASGIHVLLEKPITTTPAEAQDLIDLARANNLVLQIGHLERFNPAIQSVWSRNNDPLFIESHRLAPFNIRGTDVNVVLDLMIHDIDIILSLVKSPLTEIRASGIPILTSAVDIANARFEFANGCVANVTASRVSNKHMRKMRLFQKNSYVSIDFHAHNVAFHHAGDDTSADSDAVPIIVEKQNYQDGDALLTEIQAFVESICTGTEAVVSGEDGKRALEVALEIVRLIGIGGDDENAPMYTSDTISSAKE